MTLAFAAASGLCMIYPDRPVSAGGWAGLALAVAAVVLLGADMRRQRKSTKAVALRSGMRRGWSVFMALAFVTNVFMLYMFRLCAEFMPPGDDSQTLPFLAIVHAVLGLAGLALGLLGHGRGRVAAALAYGSAGGAMLVAGGVSSVLAMASGALPGSLLLPITNGGSALAVTVLSVIFLRERPGWSGWAGIASGVAGMLLLGWAAR
jgi:drug/metabolite transporter (DMT)-like permease